MTRLFTACALLLALSLVHGVGEAQDSDQIIKDFGAKLADKDPKVRADAAENLARANNAKAAEMLCRAILVESDSAAGARMGAAFSLLRSDEALDALGKQLPKWTKVEQIFPVYWALSGVARGATPKGDALVKTCAVDSKPKEYYIKAASAEAISVAARTELAPVLADLLKQYTSEWDEKGAIVALTGTAAVPKLVKADTDKKLRDPLLLACVDILEKTKSDRVLYFAARTLSVVAGEKLYIDPKFWRWWIEHGKGMSAKDSGEGETSARRKVPEFFETQAVGKRICYVIDMSGSMSGPVQMPPQPKREPKPEEKPKGPTTGRGEGDKGDKGKKEPEAPEPPDYSKVKTKLDLAKVELIYSLKQLTDDYVFNIVIYHTPSDLIDTGTKAFVKATPENKNRFIKLVEKLAPLELTNIHGGLLDGLSVTDKGFIDNRKEDPATHPDALLCGAETIFFLTDGSPTYSDDSNNIGEMRRDPNQRLGNGKFVDPQNILDDILRINTFRKVVIHSVGIGPHDGRLLQALSQATGGTYIDRTGVAPR